MDTKHKLEHEGDSQSPPRDGSWRSSRGPQGITAGCGNQQQAGGGSRDKSVKSPLPGHLRSPLLRTCCSTIWNVLLFSPGSSSVIGALGVSVQVLGCGRRHPEDHLLLSAHTGPASPVHPGLAEHCTPLLPGRPWIQCSLPASFPGRASASQQLVMGATRVLRRSCSLSFLLGRALLSTSSHFTQLRRHGLPSPLGCSRQAVLQACDM